jgi:hypothetical protein
MVAAVGTRVTEADGLVGISSAVDLRVTAGDVLVALNYPSPFVRTSMADGLISIKSDIPLRVSQAAGQVAIKSDTNPRVSNAAVLVAARGRTANPKLRAWTFSLDGHDFYVLRLGTIMTLVYDVYSEQWMDWDALSETYWPVNIGINWVGGTRHGRLFGSNVLVGDDSYGLLWFLDPEQPYDENPVAVDPEQEVFFERVVQGQVPIKGREVLPCYAAWLTTNMGDPAYVGAGVLLETSDDGGATYDDMGTVTVTTLASPTPEIAWYSLGQIEAPGRLFRITDDGAVARIDGMEMNDPQ